MSSIVHGKLENQVVHYHTTMLRACVVMSHDISAVLPILRVRIVNWLFTLDRFCTQDIRAVCIIYISFGTVLLVA